MHKLSSIISDEYVDEGDDTYADESLGTRMGLPYIPSQQTGSWDNSSAFASSSLIENEYFQETPLEVADYITKCFSNKLT